MSRLHKRAHVRKRTLLNTEYALLSCFFRGPWSRRPTCDSRVAGVLNRQYKKERRHSTPKHQDSKTHGKDEHNERESNVCPPKFIAKTKLAEREPAANKREGTVTVRFPLTCPLRSSGPGFIHWHWRAGAPTTPRVTKRASYGDGARSVRDSFHGTP